MMTALPMKEGPLAISQRKPKRKNNRARRGPQEPLGDLDPRLDARQTRAFDLCIQGFSNHAIAEVLGVSRETITRDIMCEAERRSAERSAERSLLIERSVSRYERWISDATLRVNELKKRAERTNIAPLRLAIESQITREVSVMLKAQRQSEAVQGLHAVIKVDASTTNIGNVHVDITRDAFDSLTPDVRARIRDEARAQRLADADAIKNVTPLA